jgi:hypothetical protein
MHPFHRHDDVPRDVVFCSLLRAQWEQGDPAQVPGQIGGALADAFATSICVDLP